MMPCRRLVGVLVDVLVAVVVVVVVDVFEFLEFLEFRKSPCKNESTNSAFS